MAKVVAPSSLTSASHDITGGAPRTGKSIKRKTPSELRGEQLKRSNGLDLLDKSPSNVFASDNALGNGLKKSVLLRNPRYIETRMDEVFPAKKSRVRILSGKDNAKESSQMEQASSFMNISSLPNLVASQCKENSVGSTDVANDKTAKSSQIVESGSQSVFRSVTELSSGGDKLTGLTCIDMGKALKGLAAREPTAITSLPLDSSKRSNDASSTCSSDFCSESCILGQKAPLDLTLKTSMRVVSSSPLNWIHKKIVSASLPQFSIQIGSQEQIRNTSAGLPPASKAADSVVLHSWIYPQSTLPSSLVSALNSSAAEAEFLSRRQLAWEDSFQSLYYMFRNNVCRVFYVCTSQFVVMFTSGDASRGNKNSCNAYLSQSTRGLRSILSEHDVSFSMPLCRSKVEQVNSDDLVELSEIEKFNLGQIYVFQTRRVRSFSDVDRSSQSLLFFSENKDVHGLYDILLNYRSFLTTLAGMDVPVLLSPVPFQNAALSSPQVKFKELRSANHIAAISKGNSSKDGDFIQTSSVGVSYSFEISDAYIPPWVISSVCAVMGSEGTSFEASFTTVPVSIGLNVALGSVDSKPDSRATSSEGFQPTNDAFGIPNAIASLSLRSGLLKGLKYSDSSFTASLSPA
ncbi:protein downstream neighbor of Son-like isoform X2 [Cucurbita moschata]|uniref:Protein downstream neighbor of Son-like isoform X2 n=1 Tax=Cucurbita moschata TaxID=3662 RepID=A0A6J1G502_CUCMO|nr:protein downstream neighbor of Son-like isoform X2 [Cucurbita moschata]